MSFPPPYLSFTPPLSVVLPTASMNGSRGGGGGFGDQSTTEPHGASLEDVYQILLLMQQQQQAMQVQLNHLTLVVQQMATQHTGRSNNPSTTASANGGGVLDRSQGGTPRTQHQPLHTQPPPTPPQTLQRSQDIHSQPTVPPAAPVSITQQHQQQEVMDPATSRQRQRTPRREEISDLPHSITPIGSPDKKPTAVAPPVPPILMHETTSAARGRSPAGTEPRSGAGTPHKMPTPRNPNLRELYGARPADESGIASWGSRELTGYESEEEDVADQSKQHPNMSSSSVHSNNGGSGRHTPPPPSYYDVPPHQSATGRSHPHHHHHHHHRAERSGHIPVRHHQTTSGASRERDTTKTAAIPPPADAGSTLDTGYLSFESKQYMRSIGII